MTEPANTVPADQTEDYDVVLDVLQKHIDKLWDMSRNKEDWGIMDYIRMEQIDKCKTAMKLWKNYKQSE